MELIRATTIELLNRQLGEGQELATKAIYCIEEHESAERVTFYEDQLLGHENELLLEARR